MSDYEKYINEEDFFSSDDSYKFKLNDFEGPLDALLYLIKKSKMSIQDVKISEITEQYMEFMKEIDSIDIDKASEFITMAALLLEIKSKALLPKPIEAEPVDTEDPEKELRLRLEVYKLYKEASEKMKNNETVDVFYRMPHPSIGEPRLRLSDMNKNGLIEALQKMFIKLEERAALYKERRIVKDRFSVDDMMKILTSKLNEKKEVSLFSLFDVDYTKSEIITTFQALLELIKNQVVVARQNTLFDDILIQKLEGTNNGFEQS